LIQKKVEDVIARLAAPDIDRVPIGMETLRHLGIVGPDGECGVSAQHMSTPAGATSDLVCSPASLAREFQWGSIELFSPSKVLALWLTIPPNSVDLARIRQLTESNSWGTTSNLGDMSSWKGAGCEKGSFIFLSSMSDYRRYIPSGVVLKGIYIRHMTVAGPPHCAIDRTDIQISIGVFD
jgi:hypothetical protein